MISECKSNSDGTSVAAVMATYVNDSPDLLYVALCSALKQELIPTQIILAGDGPLSDKQYEVIRRFEREAVGQTMFEFIQLPKNKGPAAARNAAIKAVNSHYTAIFDADDDSLPSRLKIQLSMIINGGYDLISADVLEINETGTIVSRKNLPVDSNAILRAIPYYNPINNPAVFARSAVLKKHPYPENLRVCEDYALWCELVGHGYRLGNHPDPLVLFRRPKDFHLRRRGFAWAYGELAARLHAFRFLHWSSWPSIVVMALVMGSVRIMPGLLIDFLYKVRRKI